jgi:glycosyltransferase involved in cell wall biosynthesis
MSKTIFILAPYPKGEAPSQRFRFEQYLDLLKNEGYIVEYHPFISIRTWKSLYVVGGHLKKIRGLLGGFLRRFLLLWRLRKADFVFIHREASHFGPPVFEFIIAKLMRKRIIYDFDDAIWLPNYSESNAAFQRLKAYWKVKFIMRWAYKISAGNNYLANFAKQYNQNVDIIPTTIDTINHHTLLSNHAVSKPVIGWTGSHTTMHYLDDLIPVLAELEQQFDFEFVVISNEKPNYSLRSLRYVKWNKETEIQDLALFNIGVMPLKADIWAEGKCGFKGLQYMALGITAIMSPIGVNTSIIQDEENGFLAQTPQEWKDKLTKLLHNSTLRKEIGLNGYKTIQERYSVTAVGPKFLQLFHD